MTTQIVGQLQAPGERPRDVRFIGEFIPPFPVRKALISTEGTTSGTAEDITGLTDFLLDASSVYMIEGFAVTEGTDVSTTMNLSVSYSGTTSSGNWMVMANSATSENGITGSLPMDITNTGDSRNAIRGSIHTTTAGVLDFRFNRPAGIGTANMKAGTWFELTKV